MPPSLEKNRRAFLLSELVLLVALLVVLGTVHFQSDASQRVVHTREVLECMESAVAAIYNAESQEGGYLLTGDTRFLKRYQSAVTSIPGTLEALARLTADNAVQQHALASVRSAVKERLAQFDGAIAMRGAARDNDPALEIIRLGRDDPIIANLWEAFANMRAEEERLLALRAPEASRARSWTLGTVSGFGGIALLLLWRLRALMARDATRIRLSEERLATTLTSVGDAVLATDARGHIERMNPVAERLTGWNLTEARGQPIDTVFRIINKDTRAPDESRFEKILREGQVGGLANHTLLIAKDGSERPIEDSGAPIRELDGSIAGVVLVFKDATERYAAERALRESEGRFRALADNMPTLCWMADETGSIYWYNNRWYQYTGTTLEQMQGWGWQSVHHPEMLPTVLERWKRSIASGEPFEMVFPLKAADGAFRDFLTRVAPVRDESNRIKSWFGTNTDIADQRTAESALREADRRKDEFLATLAHELRNPLAPIRNAVRLLRPDVSVAIQAQARDIIERQSAQMANLLDDLLDVSRITRGIVALRFEVLDVRKIVEEVVLANRPLIEGLHHTLTVRVAGDPLWVKGDATRLHQVLNNLLQNAAKYTDPGGRIEVSAAIEEGEIVLCVADNGIGLAADTLDRVFELFTQVLSSDRGRSGLGIGLSVVKQLVILHGGRIDVESAGLGAGSRFRVILPETAHSGSAQPLHAPRG